MIRSTRTTLLAMAFTLCWLCVAGQAQQADPATPRLASRPDLKQPISLEFINSPLADVMLWISHNTKLDIEIDRREISNAGLDRATITFSAREVPLESGLRRMLSQVELDFVVREGFLLVSTEDAIAEILETKTYDVSDLVSPVTTTGQISPQCEALAESITSTIHPTTWDEVGGPASVSAVNLRGVQMLVIAQQPRIHSEIAELLDSLREKLAANPELVNPQIRFHEIPQNEILHGRMLAGIDEQESMLIDYHTRGCFHEARYGFRFSGAALNQVEIFSLPSENNDAPRQRIGTLELTKADLRGINSLLNFYRSGPRGNCSKIDTIKITWHRDGKEIATESFTDSSCSMELNGMLPLHHLVSRVTSSKPDINQP
jgi:hypothetical protein